MERMEIPPSWESLTLSTLGGVILVVGATDTGKTTFARYLYRRLADHHNRLAFVDGDVGQATLGPPATMTVALGDADDDRFPPSGPRFRTFVGDISPTGHMLPAVVGAHKLVEKAREAGTSAIVFDTTGLVNPSDGGRALKLALVDLLRPRIVVGLQRGRELEHLLVPLRRSQRTRVIDLEVVEAVARRARDQRRAHRAERYRRAFEGAKALNLSWSERAVIPSPSFPKHRLVALEDAEGFVLELGIVTDRDPSRSMVELLTPLSCADDVDAIHLGDVTVDPETFRDRHL